MEPISYTKCFNQNIDLMIVEWITNDFVRKEKLIRKKNCLSTVSWDEVEGNVVKSYTSRKKKMIKEFTNR